MLLISLALTIIWAVHASTGLMQFYARNMTTGVHTSPIEVLEITDGDDMDASVALIRIFSTSMTELNLSHGGLSRNS